MTRISRSPLPPRPEGRASTPKPSEGGSSCWPALSRSPVQPRPEGRVYTPKPRERGSPCWLAHSRSPLPGAWVCRPALQAGWGGGGASGAAGAARPFRSDQLLDRVALVEDVDGPAATVDERPRRVDAQHAVHRAEDVARPIGAVLGPLA